MHRRQSKLTNDNMRTTWLNWQHALTKFVLVMSAEALINKSATATCPYLHANIKGVQPSWMIMTESTLQHCPQNHQLRLTPS
jgi:hypothetical protein